MSKHESVVPKNINFILSTIAYPLVFHSIDLSSYFNHSCLNFTYHKHSMKGVNVNNLDSFMR